MRQIVQYKSDKHIVFIIGFDFRKIFFNQCFCFCTQLFFLGYTLIKPGFVWLISRARKHRSINLFSVFMFYLPFFLKLGIGRTC